MQRPPSGYAHVCKHCTRFARASKMDSLCQGRLLLKIAKLACRRGRPGSAGREQGLVGFVAALVALARKVRQVVCGNVAGDVMTVEARSLEFLEPRIGRAHRTLERLELLVDQEVGA